MKLTIIALLFLGTLILGCTSGNNSGTPTPSVIATATPSIAVATVDSALIADTEKTASQIGDLNKQTTQIGDTQLNINSGDLDNLG